jgi:lipid-A-disaccharide synthase
VEPATRRFLIVAGEASGDRHAARVVECLRRRGSVDVRGIAGPAMRAAGVTAIGASDELAVVGFTGVVARLPRILGLIGKLKQLATQFRPEVAILVDSPGFNFRIGPELHRRGVRVLYYIAPQVWAWHAERAAEMAVWVDRLAVVFPFEAELFRRAGVDTEFVGHPLLEETPAAPGEDLHAQFGVAPSTRLVGLLPGSRPGELRAHLGVMVEAARRLAARRPDVLGVVALAPGLESQVPESLRRDDGPVRVRAGITRLLQRSATCCAVASGTATLETAIAGTPLVVVYKTGGINYAIARRVVRLERIGLPNIVAGADVAPELIQDAFTPERLADLLGRWLDDPAALAGARRGLEHVRGLLGTPGAAERVADLAWTLASGARPAAAGAAGAP